MTLYLRPGNQIYTTENAEYVDVYNLQNLPSHMTKIDYKEQQYVHHNKVHNEVYAEDKAISLQIQAKQTYSSEYYETFGGGIYSSALEINDQGAPALTTRPIYDSITRNGVQIADSVSSYKSSVAIINTHNNTAYSGWYKKKKKKSLYSNNPNETKILHTFAYYSSTKTKHNTDSIVSEIKRGVSTTGTTEKYSWGYPEDRTSWADTSVTSSRWYNNGTTNISGNKYSASEWGAANNSSAWRGSSTHWAGNAGDRLIQSLFPSYPYNEDSYSYVEQGHGVEPSGQDINATGDGPWGKITFFTGSSTVRTQAIEAGSNSYQRSVMMIGKKGGIRGSFYMTWSRSAYINNLSGRYDFKLSFKGSKVTYTYSYFEEESKQSLRVYVTGNLTQKYTSNKYVSGQSSQTWDRWRTYTWGLSVSKFTDAHTYQWNEPIYSTHSSITVRAKYKKQTSDSEYTFRTSQVSEVNTYTTLSTYTTAHTYSLDTLVNNVNV